MNTVELANAEWWESLWSSIEFWAFALVAFALAVEFVAHWTAKPHQKKIEHAKQLEIETLKNENFNLAIQLEAERKDRLGLESAILPRLLTFKVDDTYPLKEFKGAKIAIHWVEVQDRETMRLAELLRSVLMNCGWTVTVFSPTPWDKLTFPGERKGILITSYDSGFDWKLEEPAIALKHAIEEAGGECNAFPFDTKAVPPVPPGVIRTIISINPSTYLEDKLMAKTYPKERIEANRKESDARKKAANVREKNRLEQLRMLRNGKSWLEEYESAVKLQQAIEGHMQPDSQEHPLTAPEERKE